MFERIAEELQINTPQVEKTARLLDDGATVPFLSRYRKEVTGGLDEEAIRSVRDKLEAYRELEKRRASILATIEEQGNLTPQLEKAIEEAHTLAVLEDIYLPYRPKKRTRGMIAEERGLRPLSEALLEMARDPHLSAPRVINPQLNVPRQNDLQSGKQDTGTPNVPSKGKRNGGRPSGGRISPQELATYFINPEQSVNTGEDALAGARDIIAEMINETAAVRNALRRFFQQEAVLSSLVVKKKRESEEAQKYRDYFAWKEPARKAPSHRVLALLRGADEGFLTVHFLPNEEEAITLVEKKLQGSLFSPGLYDAEFRDTDLRNANLRNTDPGDAGPNDGSRAEAYLEQIRRSIGDGYKRLLAPSLETELRGRLKENADKEAVTVFAENLRELLLAPPLGQKTTLGIDPGQRTGCKVVCLDKQGDLLHTTTVYPLPPRNKREESARVLRDLVKQYAIEAVAVGNGTGGRETLQFCEQMSDDSIIITSVNESGASVYSASKTAREEFPDHDVTVRGAVSIARRLMDPLAELVKIDPKAIGVGQYQHDVDQKLLKKSLDDVVISCVNSVGVELNSASRRLLEYVSGLTSKTAEAIIEYRGENFRKGNGGFTSRDQLTEVKGLGAKTFEQAAGFLRIRDGGNPLDASAVHPERYELVEEMARDLGVTLQELVGNEELCKKIDPSRYVSAEAGLPTLTDILTELEKPGRDPRETFKPFHFREDVHTLEDVEPDMVLPGIVTNVTDFGAFVDVGVHQDGLVHISEMSDKYVSNPRDVVKVHQQVSVKVLSVDVQRRRIGLSMK